MTPVLKFEVELGASGGGYTNVTTDVLKDPAVEIMRGCTSNDPLSMVSQAGSLRFAMNNSNKNSASTSGYYSPWSSSRRAGWRIGIKVKLTATDENGDHVEFVGWITKLDVTPGLHSRRDVIVTAQDWMYVAGRYTITSALPTLTNTDIVTCFNDLVTSVPTQYLPESYLSDGDLAAIQIPFAFDNIKQDKPNLLSELQKLAQSSLSRIYVLGTGEVCQTLSMDIEALSLGERSTNIGTLAETDIYALSMPADRSIVTNRIRMTATPRSTTGAGAILFTDTSDLAVAPGAEVKIRCQFTDPNQRAARVGCKTLTAPVATTDYTFNSAADGSGTDLTASFSVTAVANGGNALVTITNNHATLTGHRTFMQLRGNGLLTYSPQKAEIFDADSEAAYGSSPVTIDMPYQHSIHNPFILGNGSSVVDKNSGGMREALRRWMSPRPANPSVTFIADTSAKQVLFFKDIGSFSGGVVIPYINKVTISESITGINAEFYIRGLKKTYGVDNRLTCTWYLDNAEPIIPWILGTSELGIDDVLS